MGFLSNLFGGGDNSASEKAAKDAKKAAKEAEAKEAARVARLNKAMASIKAAFHGGAATAAVPHKYDWKTFNANDYDTGDAVAGLPKGWTFVRTEGGGTAAVPKSTAAAPAATPVKLSAGNPYAKGSAAAAKWENAHGKNVAVPVGGGQSTNNPSGYNDGKEGGNSDFIMNGKNGGAGGAGGAGGKGGGGGNGEPTWQIKGPDGKLYNVGDDVVYSTDPAQAATTGFDQAFYDKYKNAMLTNYLPQVAKQYGEASDETLFRLANAGTTQSSAAVDAFSDLSYQNKINKANVASDADKAVGDLKKTIATTEDNAILQAQSVEDPTIAVNSALSKVNTLQDSTPGTNVLGDVFKVAAIGGANALGGYQSASNAKRVADLLKGTNSVVS